MSGLVGQVLLLTALTATVGLGPAGWVAGLASAAVVDVTLAHGLIRDPTERLGPAGWVTLARATLALGVAALAADSFVREVPVALLVGLAAVALVLDYVDGEVARRTGTVSELGGRLDGEVDAFLILALSVYVAPIAGAWVLAIGAARYVFLAAGWDLPWMRAQLPRRDWRKTVAATQGVVLTIAAADVLPLGLVQAALAIALAMLAESFGRDVLWLWHRRGDATAEPPAADEKKAVTVPDRGPSRRRRVRRAVGIAFTVAAVALVWAALVAPDQPNHITFDAFARLPLEGLIVIALALVLPRNARRVLAWIVGPLLGALVVLKLLDVGFFTAFDRPFNPVEDWRYTSIGIETLRESIGRTRADLVIAGVVAVVAAALVLPTLAVLRVTRVASGNRTVSTRAIAALAIVWALFWAVGAQLAGEPIASTSAAELAMHEVRAVEAGLQDGARYAAAIKHDRYAHTPGNRLLTRLSGKDVLVIFDESYGKVAVQGSSFSPQVDATLAAGTRQLHAAGFSSASGWLTSPTFGGTSWLAHSTLQSGSWVDNQGRYDELMASNRFTLGDAFKRAGWRIVDDIPSDNRPWKDGTSFYHFDKIYNRLNVGYHGPTYAYASMPDQFTYLALQRLELAKRHRKPVFAEIDTVSSHEPWTRIPPLISWSEVGDGSIYKTLPVDTTGSNDAGEGYGHSIVYSLQALFSYIENYGRKNLVVVVLGDHQPAHVVSGYGVDHEVPISIIAHDPSVFRQIAPWGWANGMRPSAHGPVWRMSAFRNRFLGSFGPRPTTP
ncbi:MAG TPA: CDP-alcohol phosphatidyltransferase family protein [Gaiellales bacterium]|nr:CDP-alcohol phosphatidyltransferase family protein [Gaiellales bacterium]